MENIADECKELTIDGIKRADANADEEWKETALICIAEVAKTLREFTSDDVADVMAKYPEVDTHDKRAMGPVFLRAMRKGYITKTNRFIPNTRQPKQHSCPARIWESNLYGV